jgi:hypothetical protein
VVDNTMDALAWLRKQLDGDENDLLREMVRELAQRLMAAEVDAPHRSSQDSDQGVAKHGQATRDAARRGARTSTQVDVETHRTDAQDRPSTYRPAPSAARAPAGVAAPARSRVGSKATSIWARTGPRPHRATNVPPHSLRQHELLAGPDRRGLRQIVLPRRWWSPSRRVTPSARLRTRDRGPASPYTSGWATASRIGSDQTSRLRSSRFQHAVRWLISSGSPSSGNRDASSGRLTAS